MRNLCLLTILILAAPAHAQPPQTPIVLEVYTGERPPEADRVVGPIVAQLVSRNYRAGYVAVGRPFEDQVSRGAVSAAGLPKTFLADVDKGFKAWVGGNFQDAVNVLEPLVQAADENAGAFAVCLSAALSVCRDDGTDGALS